MKIAHISETFLPRIGGIETALTTLFQHTRDIDHVVFTNPWSTSPRVETMDSNVVVRRVPPSGTMLESLASLIPSSRWAERMANAAPLVVHLLREANRRHLISKMAPPVDLVHIHSAARARYFLNLDRKTGLRLGGRLVDWWLDAQTYPAPVLFTDHSLFGGSHDQFTATFGGEIVRRIRNLVCVERSGYENVTTYSRDHGLDNRIWHVPNPVDTSRFRFDPLPDSPSLIIGYAARADKSGVAEIIRLARDAPAWAQFRLALAGDVQSVVLPEIPRTVLREWNVPHTSMPAFYAGIHVLLDSFSFGVPRTVLEALSSGRAVIRLRPSGQGLEEVPSRVSPILTPNPEEIFAYLESLASDRAKLERMSREARAYAEQTFDARLVADQYRKIYGTVTADRQPPIGSGISL